MSMDRPPREQMAVDIVVVGGGPAGLATAISLKQRAPDAQVLVIEKAAEPGGHILSGAVIDPSGLDALFPDWRTEADFARAPVTQDDFYFLTRSGSLRLPGWCMPPLMSNHGNFVVSLGEVTVWLARKAEELGVEIFPGFAATELLVDENGGVIGVATGDAGIGRNGEPGGNYAPGMELLASYVVLAEGARGSLTKQAIARFGLDQGREPQKYGLGLKEVWRVPSDRHRPGLVQHTLGWPLDDRTGGGSFLYHDANGQVVVGFVVHLNYANPYLSPFEEFQRFKTHPLIAATLKGGERLHYGARAISEGGWQSVPKLVFPGGLLVGDSAGFVNVPRIKGSHNAMLSGIAAGNAIAAALSAGRSHDELAEYSAAIAAGPVRRDLWPVRNAKPLLSRFCTLLGTALSGFDMWVQTIIGASPFGTLRHRKADHEATEPAARHRPIDYPKPDNVLSFDRLSSVFVSNTNHSEDQPAHLRVADMERQRQTELGRFAGPSQRYCPAGVYEWMGQGADASLTINAQNCLHCKTCDIKDPAQNITWVPPEGGGGPNYVRM